MNALQTEKTFTTENAILALSRTFSLLSLNAGAKRLFGCNPSPGERWPLNQVFAADDLSVVSTNVDAVLNQATRSAPSYASILHADGRPIPCEYTVQPIIRGASRVIGVILTIRHIDLRPTMSLPRKTSIPSRISSIGSRGVFNHLPNGSFTIDNHWRITAFNHAAEAITGYDCDRVLGRHCWEIFQSDLCGKVCPMRLAMDSKKAEMDRQVWAANRHGLRQLLTVNVSLLKDQRGRIVGAVETFHPADDNRPVAYSEPGRFNGIIGNSGPMRDLFAKLPDLAVSRANVLICGESGTGKELIARTLHKLSESNADPFVAVNCAALPETLIEAELFGHEKGAFTGADQSRPGRFEMAGKGTLLLDEIGELRPDLQVKLLRVIEQRSFERVGGNRTIALKARLISATNKDLNRAIEERTFREDLYYRLRTVAVTVPPLRERPGDIPLLVDHFIERFNEKTGKQVRSLDPKVMQQFMAYAWPGNVRELERVIEHAFVFVKGPVIFRRYLPEMEALPADYIRQQPPRTVFDTPVVDSNDRETLIRALDQSGGKRAQAAELLGISRTSLWRRMKQMGLKP